jgi:peptidoglycan lytic transglycosylase
MSMNCQNKMFFILFLVIIVSSCQPAVRYSNSRTGNNADSQKGDILRGKASFYADFFEGRLTANGEVFDQSRLTAAHKSLKFGTIVRVTNLKNGKSIVVKINDRGPFVAGRIIDLSKEAARQIGMIQDGVVDVTVEILN